MSSEVNDLIAKAKKAQKHLATFSQSKIDRIIAAMAQAGKDAAQMLARLATGETGMGRVESKTAKNLFSVEEIYESICNQKTTGVLGYNSQGYYEIAEPVGIVCGIIPTTNPTSTTLFKALIALKARNCIIFSPHPRATKCIGESAYVMYKAALAAGAPKDCIGWIKNPTLEATQTLMSHKDTAVILATGGPGLVKAAYSSGKPAFGVGAGNTPTIIEASADIPYAARCIVESQLFDYGTVCSSEQSIIADASIKNQMIAELKKRKAYFLSDSEVDKLSPVAIKNCLMSPKIVGQPAYAIAEMAGISVPKDTSVLIAPLQGVGEKYPLSYEKLAPILGFFTVNNWQEASDLSLDLLNLGGKGHTLGIHSTNHDIVMEIALRQPISRIVANAPTTQGGIGLATYLKPSMTLGCGTFGRNITSDNISAHHLINVKKVAAIDPRFALWEHRQSVDKTNAHIEISEDISLPAPETAVEYEGNYTDTQQNTSIKLKSRGWPFTAID